MPNLNVLKITKKKILKFKFNKLRNENTTQIQLKLTSRPAVAILPNYDAKYIEKN